MSGTWRDVVDTEVEGVCKTIGDVRPSLGQSPTPFCEIDLFDFFCCIGGRIGFFGREFDVDSPLANSTAAHAREIGFAADFEREATIQQVIPRVPFLDASSVHGADEVADPFGRRHTDFHRTDAVHFRDRKIR